MTMRPVLASLALLGSMIPLFAGDGVPGEVFYVDNKNGSDSFDGRSADPKGGNSGPLKTIMQAVRSCSVGARIEIANTGTDYRESISIEGFKKGRADAPLVIDGHGATVNGLQEIPADQWISLKDDIYYFVNRVGGADYKPRGWFDRKIGDSYYGPMPRNIWIRTSHEGWFTEKEAPNAPQIFLIDGKPGPNVLKLEDLPQGGFFYDSKALTLKEPAGQTCLYLRLPEGKQIKDCVVSLPLNSGIYIGDDYVTVQNIGSCYSVEDGFDGFWGQGVVFRNIHAFSNTEQGVSFHGNGTTIIDGALIEGNGGDGIVDVMSCTTIYRDVTVRRNHPAGILFRGFAHAMYNCVIEGNSGVQISSMPETAVSFVNCLIDANDADGSNTHGYGSGLVVDAGGYARLDHCTIMNASTGINVQKGLSIKNSIVSGCKTVLKIDKGALSDISLSKTILCLGKIDAGGTMVDQTAWGEFSKSLKASDAIIVDSLELEGPLRLLPKDSPHAKSAENGMPPGAQIKPVKN